MLTDGDVKKIIDALLPVFATKNELQEAVDTMTEKFADLQTSVDVYALKADKYYQEMLVLNHQIDRNAKHFKQIAKHLDFKLEY